MSALEPILDHIHQCLSEIPHRPLFVALQGPQGSGKTFLTERIAAAFSASTPSVRVATLSIDDLYLPHDGLVALAVAHPQNSLLHGRGQPGTHDTQLGERVLEALRSINTTHGNKEVRLPAFDKAEFTGEGDRVPQDRWRVVHGPLDVVLLEGWCVGFYPQDRTILEAKMRETPAGLEGVLDLPSYTTIENVFEINALLAQYVHWWDMMDAFVQITPEESSPYVHIYKWRLQQEHAMKAKNGGKGMTDEQVKTFVDRYIPGYHFFGRGVRNGGADPDSGCDLIPPWISGNGVDSRLLQIIIGEARQVLRVERL